jgi:hypothetical protein
MLNTTPIVIVCPAGRHRYLAVLMRHLFPLWGLVDHVDFWVNTAEPLDLAYLDTLEKQYGSFVRLVKIPPPPTLTPRGKSKLGMSYHIGAFYPHAAEPGTVYVRLDDDICYIHPGAIQTLVEYRLAHPEPFLVYPTIVNNSLMSHLLQKAGAFGKEKGDCPYEILGRGRHDGRFAEFVHRKFIEAIKRRDIAKWQLPARRFSDYERVSVNCISWLGADMALCAHEVGELEEGYLSAERPRALNRPNALCGAAVVAHFAYGAQRGYIDRTDLLREYTRLA